MPEQRFSVVVARPGRHGRPGLWAVWDREKRAYVNSSRNSDDMYDLARALNAASFQDDAPAKEPSE